MITTPAPTARPLSDWDARIVEDMRNYIRTIERAIANPKRIGGLIRPVIGDARPMPLAHWEAEIAKNLRWISEIEAQYN